MKCTWNKELKKSREWRFAKREGHFGSLLSRKNVIFGRERGKRGYGFEKKIKDFDCWVA